MTGTNRAIVGHGYAAERESPSVNCSRTTVILTCSCRASLVDSCRVLPDGNTRQESAFSLSDYGRKPAILIVADRPS